MPNTVKFKYPYPDPAAPISLGAADIRALAEAIEAAQTVAPSVTPPAAPFDGQIWIFPADAANGILWTFRYKAASASPYKWEFVGGSELVVTASASFAVAPGTQLRITPPDIILPRSGEYDADAVCRFGVPTANQQCYLGITNASAGTLVGLQFGMVIANYDSIPLKTPISGNVGQTFSLYANVPIAGIAVDYRAFGLTPRRVA